MEQIRKRIEKDEDGIKVVHACIREKWMTKRYKVVCEYVVQITRRRGAKSSFKRVEADLSSRSDQDREGLSKEAKKRDDRDSTVASLSASILSCRAPTSSGLNGLERLVYI